MGARARPLAPDEIAIGGGDATLLRRHRLTVGRAAERASGFAPLETGVLEDHVEAACLRFPLDRRRAGNDPGPHAVRDLAAAGDGCCLGKVTEPPVSAG